MGIGAAPFAVPMGAKVVEKHFTLDKALPGPDHKASLTPDELVAFVQLIKKVDSYMGSYIKKPNVSEIETRKSLQKCIVAKESIKKGTLFTEENIVAKRTGGVGLSPIKYMKLIGKVSAEDYQKDDIIKL